LDGAQRHPLASWPQMDVEGRRWFAAARSLLCRWSAKRTADRAVACTRL